jgi:hypothetical protein
MGIIIWYIIVEPGMSVSTVTRLRAAQPRNCGLCLVMGKVFFYTSKILHHLWSTPGIFFQRTTEAFLLELLRNITGTRLCYKLSRTKGHRTAGKIKSMKNAKDSTNKICYDTIEYGIT